MEFPVFVKFVQQWADERGILEHGTQEGQFLKLLSEYGELCDAHAKTDEAARIDAVGDVLVCVVMTTSFVPRLQHAAARLGADIGDPRLEGLYMNPGEYLHYNLLENLYKFSLARTRDLGSLEQFAPLRDVVNTLHSYCKASNLDIRQCMQAAWDEIKDRKGRMSEGGVFVKDEA